MKRSAVYFRGGLILIVVGTVFSMPNVLAISGSFPELGEAWRSPMGVALGAIAVLGGMTMVVFAFRCKAAEKAAKRRRDSTGSAGS